MSVTVKEGKKADCTHGEEKRQFRIERNGKTKKKDREGNGDFDREKGEGK